jgi:hypothetical protein
MVKAKTVQKTNRFVNSNYALRLRLRFGAYELVWGNMADDPEWVPHGSRTLKRSRPAPSGDVGPTTVIEEARMSKRPATVSIVLAGACKSQFTDHTKK